MIAEPLSEHDPTNYALKVAPDEQRQSHWSDSGSIRRFSTSHREHAPSGAAEPLSPRTQDPVALDHAAGASYFMADIMQDSGDLAGALESYRKAISIRNSAQAATPHEKTLLQTHVAGDYAGMARVLARQGQLGSAIDAQRQATTLMEGLSASDPTNATIRSFLAGSYHSLGHGPEGQW